MNMKEKKVALVVGSFIALVHLVWVILVALGWAQPLIDFSARMHSVTTPVTVLPFDFARSLFLVIIAFCVGYVFGYVFATLWNKLHK